MTQKQILIIQFFVNRMSVRLNVLRRCVLQTAHVGICPTICFLKIILTVRDCSQPPHYSVTMVERHDCQQD